ncbi:MAG: hypothetical protein KDJ31_11605 [Candidatus Competibacteraceae bacterium]|nr:hypothetical protein [Candidatus Competibacteraceae bacterium]HRY14600.1 hypothetical protein [Candidatus Competibacteraceae bacterium]
MELLTLPAVQQTMDEAERQLEQYRRALEERYRERLWLRTHTVVALGLDRLAWA